MSQLSEDWYRTGVFYEVAVHSFQDSNGDGFGDIPGLIERLDYLAWLGVSVVWMLPILPSPMLDGGYDVTDLTGIREGYGTLDDVRTLIDEAHKRGIRVITDFVINHTSDQHPWFIEARKPGSPKRDWYVWTDDPRRYGDARVIFVDTHDSNWSWDDVAGEYFWHRFFDHQPDLNYENPEVQDAVMDAIWFWLDLGFDGLRLDAVPYLFEEDGTVCENLPATHAYLKRIRAVVDREYPDAVILAEANQWPIDVLPYFGVGDECHMAFHFPVMPRLFLALATGDPTPLSETLRDTPEIPDGTQWAVFLRNHDELTLEMVTDTERDTLYAEYAPDPSMRKNVGIRRRLSPLLGGDRRRIELLNAVLMSLPGSPIIYYGDEIGMGDNIGLEDRDGLRTPMQWDSSLSGGWSSAGPDQFYLPVIDDPEFCPAAVNVQDQRANEDSLLMWMRSLIALRPSEMGTAPCEPIETNNTAILGFDRGTITVFANFSDQPNAAVHGGGTVIGGNGTLDEGRVALPPFGWVWIRTVDHHDSHSPD